MPCWLVVLNALTPMFSFLGTLAIGGVAAYIAHGQWRTNKDKLKLELYDRRLAVYEATMKFILGLSGNATVDAKNMHDYLVATRQSPFLFDDASIPQYLKKLATEARRLDLAIDVVCRANGEDTTQDTYQAAVNTKFELLEWFLNQEKIVEEKFAPYLKLRG
jgi:hypothetical protein